MKPGIVLIEIDKLRAHEQVCPERLAEVTASIKRQGRINNPVVVDNQYRIILDGHHRVESLKYLGCHRVPAMFVDYFSDQIRVYSRRANLKISKKAVVNSVLCQRLFPHKTTKHLIKYRIRGVNIKLNRLK